MKSMRKSLNVSRVLGTLKRKSSNANGINGSSSGAPAAAAVPAANASPEAAAKDAVKAFCESGGNVKGDEILFLPPIVDAAESSPSAAAECARIIKKYLSKDYYSRPSWQYNALMLIRILVDNPGETFTRTLDADFVETMRKLLKHARDNRVRNMCMEMLDDFEHTKMYDQNLQGLVLMWKAQKEEAMKKNGVDPTQQIQQRRAMAAPPVNPHSQNYFARNHQNKRLPDPVELASRLEEARTSAKLLEQVVMNTPSNEMLNNELIKEFADRCLSASKSIQGYMQADNPTPDNETMESLIDTNEQLQTALNQHQRAMLSARKALGVGERQDGAAGGQQNAPADGLQNVPSNDRVLEWTRSQQELYATGDSQPPESWQRPRGNGKGKERDYGDYNSGGPSGPAVAGPSGSGQHDDVAEQNPFADPVPDDRQHYMYGSGGAGGAGGSAGNNYYQDPQMYPRDGYTGGPSRGDGRPMTADSANSGGQRSSGRRRNGDHVSDDDLYDAASPNQKEPVYRY